MVWGRPRTNRATEYSLTVHALVMVRFPGSPRAKFLAFALAASLSSSFAVELRERIVSAGLNCEGALCGDVGLGSHQDPGPAQGGTSAAEEAAAADMLKRPWLGTLTGCLVWNPRCALWGEEHAGYKLDSVDDAATNETR